MIKFEKAKDKIFNKTKRLEDTENLPLNKTIGLVLAEDIKAGLNMPPFNKSAMDGYAVRSCDLESVPGTLNCISAIKAGKSFKDEVKKGECVKIMTGSPLPKGADSVVMVEFTKEKKNDSVEIFKKIMPGENVCPEGEDIEKDEVVLKKGMVVRGPEISVAASLGKKTMRVLKRPSLAVLNTGDEIVEPGNRLGYGKIYNSNGPMLISLIEAMGMKATYLGIARDKIKDLK
ncbi:MAG: molybdopterin molybdotransferase MoeA, partial [Candidatus Omnitrophica bacterium]|nr:molybdopterin molybdotransferase MoeA [Candidatus Omnitrophota bacterium]